MSDIKYKILLILFTKNRFTKILFNKYIEKEGGEFRSETLRRIFKEKYNISVGYASYGCFDPWINYGQPIEIGNYCSFAANVHFIPGNHPVTDVSTHPYFHRAGFGYVKSRVEQECSSTYVGNDVWIGRNVIILPKCKRIGNGAIIGAGSVVTQDVEPYSIVAGNPAKEIRKRFSKEQIEKLEESKWFDYSPKELSNAFQYARDFDKFVTEVKRRNNDV